jgi:hypothetical protein
MAKHNHMKLSKRLSPALLSGAFLLVLGEVNVRPIAAYAEMPSPYFGHWTMSSQLGGSPEPLSRKGSLYKNIDIAPCGRDICGVSVNDNGECGPLLFRFLATHAYKRLFKLHSLWGTHNEKAYLGYHGGNETKNNSPIEITLDIGKDADPNGREGGMPMFSSYDTVSSHSTTWCRKY